MNKTWKTFVRPVLVLLVIGVIIGLSAIYIRIDGDKVNAEGDTNLDESVGDANGNEAEQEPPSNNNESEIPNVEEIPPETKPENARPIEQEIELNGTFRCVLDVAKGYAVISGDEENTNIVYIEENAVVYEKTVHQKYVASSVGKYGIALVTRGGEGVDVRIYDIHLNEVMCDNIPIAHGYVGIFDRDILTVLYEREGGIDTIEYDVEKKKNSLLDIDNLSPIEVMYTTSSGDAYVIFKDGMIMNTLYNIWRTRLNVGYDIGDIRPILHDGKIAYAILDKDAKDRYIHIYSSDFREKSKTPTRGDVIVYTDALYTINSVDHKVDKFCECGRLDESFDSDIEEITYINYTERRVYFKTIQGEYYVSNFGDIKHREKTDRVVLYDNNDFTLFGGTSLTLRCKETK